MQKNANARKQKHRNTEKISNKYIENKHKTLTKEEHTGICRDWLWYTRTMECSLVARLNRPHTKNCMNCKCILVREQL